MLISMYTSIYDKLYKKQFTEFLDDFNELIFFHTAKREAVQCSAGDDVMGGFFLFVDQSFCAGIWGCLLLEFVLIELDTFLNNNNLRAMECLELLRSYLGNMKTINEINQIDDQIDNFDFKTARKILGEIADKLGISV